MIEKKKRRYTVNVYRKGCPHCGGRFETIAPRQTHCSAKCHLLGKSTVADGGCRLWTGRPGGPGYGEVAIGGKRYLAHRLAYETFVGPIPEGKEFYVCHKCDNPLCIEPEHLFLGTVFTNTVDCVRKGRNHRKLDEADVIRIREEMKSPRRGKVARLAKELGVTSTLVSRVAKGKCWRHLLPDE